MTDWRRSAAYRIAFIYSGALALAVALLGGLVYFAADRAFRAQQDLALAEATAALVQDYRGQGIAPLAETIRRRSATNGVVTFGYALFDANGRRLAGDFELSLPQPGFSNVTFRDPVEGLDSARVLTTALDRDHILVVGIDSQALERIDGVILYLFAGAFALVLLVGLTGAVLLGGYLRRRLERISGTAQAIMAGDMRRRVPVSARGDEFDQLGQVLNLMLGRIAGLLDNLRQVSADVAHDLRTPLARLRGGLEAGLAQNDPAARETAIRQAVQQSDALLALFGGILRIVDVDTGDIRQGFAPVDLSGLAEDLIDSYAPAIADKGRHLSCEIAANVSVAGDRELIAQAVANLLDNAQAHTPAGTTIRLTLRADGGAARLAVEDDGPGVPADDRARIVERFVRLDRSRSASGHGLGLNLVDAIARAHGGVLAIEDAAPGLRAVLRFPLAVI
ncbi:MAG: HAMP domain-containing sensor histidine kinase [Candidatus Sphingomonas colombiensis]|nr:HAMP domain-containing sensor histidine kinase [Sphingomonas sp.]WEK42494.1 MAG: HAMP domain-containing sensor histidine kinase [Sphingomonas sp.]